MTTLFKIEYYDYTGEDHIRYIKAADRYEAGEKLNELYLVEGIWSITPIENPPETKVVKPKTTTKKKKALSLPEFVTFQVITRPDGNIIRTDYYGAQVSMEKATEIISTLFSLWWNQATKPLAQTFDAKDVFPIIRKLIDNGSLSFIQAKYIALNHCSEYVFTTELEQATA